jgi:hypothetical protein
MLGAGRPETGLRIGVVVLGVLGLAAPEVTYNRSAGAVSVDTSNGTLLFSIVVTGPEATSIDRWQDGSFQDNVLWTQSFFQGAEQWVATGWMQNLSQGQSFVDPGTY